VTVGALVPAARSTRAKLMVLLPLTMALLVAGTGFFTLSIASRAYELHGTSEVTGDLIAQLGVQIAGIALIAALLGFSIALGVTQPVRRMVEQLEALASGDLRGKLDIASTSELDSLGGAVNDAIAAIQRYYFQSMTGAVITLDAGGRVIGSSAAAEATLGYREEDLVGRRFIDGGGNRDRCAEAGRVRRYRDPRRGQPPGANWHYRLVSAATPGPLAGFSPFNKLRAGT
jgi:PAS domain-containing protein